MKSVKDKLISRIEEISKRYEYYGFWKLGKAYVNGVTRDDNPYLYFPSEKYSHKALMEEFNKLTEEDFKPIEGVNGFYISKMVTDLISHLRFSSRNQKYILMFHLIVMSHVVFRFLIKDRKMRQRFIAVCLIRFCIMHVRNSLKV